jgi:threonine synthase
LGLIDRLPRLAIVQAAGANPLYRALTYGRPFEPLEGAETLATAIRIGNPVSWKKAVRGLRATDGVVEEVTDQEILDAKAHVDRAGIGAEPASCASVAGVLKLATRGVIGRGENVVCVLTGHVLKDPDIVVAYHERKLADIASTFANPPVRCAATMAGVLAAMDEA